MKRPRFSAILRAKAIFRWKYVLPRLALVYVVYCVVHFGLDPVLHYALVAGGQAALGAKVDVAELSTSLVDGTLTINGLAATNPNKPMRNLAAAEQVRLEVDTSALLRKRLVVTSGAISGIQFDSPRAESGALEPVPADADAGPSMLDPAFTAAGEAANEWFADLQGRLEDDLESKLATPRVLKELEDRWQAQYADLKVRADDLRAKAKKIEGEFREAKKNPLRAAAQLESLHKELLATQAELKRTIAELQTLPAQAQSDRKAIDEARKLDQEFLRTALDMAKTDGGKLSEYLLGDLAHGYMAQTVGWVQYARTWVPKTKIERPARAHGTNVLFVARRLPQCLIERVELTGTAQIDGQTLDVTGLLTDASTEPQLHPRPLQLHLVSGGAIAGDVLVTIDRRRGVAHDKLVLDCPHLALGERTLGKPDSLAVQVAAGEAAITADVTLDGDQLAGTIHVRQSSTLAATTPAIRDDRIAAILGESLQGVDRLEADVTLAGTLRKPQVKIESNLGPQLAEGINGAVRRYLTDRRDRLVAKVQGQVDAQLAKLEAVRQGAQQELLGALGEDQQLVGQLASLMGGGGSLEGLVTPKLESALKLDRLKR